MRRPWQYQARHIPSGTVTTDVTGDCTKLQFLELLNRWNGNLPGIWQYWSDVV